MPAKRPFASSAEQPQYRLTPQKHHLLRELRRLRARQRLSSRRSQRELSATLQQLPDWQREHLTTLLECGFPPLRLLPLPAYLATLTPRQQKAITRLTTELRWLSEAVQAGVAQGLGPDVLGEFIKDEAQDFTRAMLKAVRAGLRHHPVAREWIAVRKALGARKALRRAKMGLERGVRLPYPEPREHERQLLKDIARLRKQGMSLRGIHQRLRPQTSWPAFYKWCARRGVRGRLKPSPPS